MKILLLKNQYQFLLAIEEFLVNNGHILECPKDEKDFFSIIETQEHDCYILFLEEPFDLCFQYLELIHQKYPQKIKIIISEYNDATLIQKAFVLGSKDYLKIPFEFQELEVRMQHHYKEMKSNEPTEKSEKLYLSEQCYLNIKTNSLLNENGIVSLSQNEQKLLLLFVDNIKQIVTDEMIYTHIWNAQDVKYSNVRVLLKRLRSKLKEDLIKNIHGRGYILYGKDK